MDKKVLSRTTRFATSPNRPLSVEAEATFRFLPAVTADESPVVARRHLASSARSVSML